MQELIDGAILIDEILLFKLVYVELAEFINLIKALIDPIFITFKFHYCLILIL